MSHAVVTNMATMQAWTFIADRVVTDEQLVLDVEDVSPHCLTTWTEEVFQNERRLTHFSRYNNLS